MIIVGAGSAGKESLEIFKQKKSNEEIIFFDENTSYTNTIFENYKLIKEIPELQKYILKNPEFCVAVGNPRIRAKLFHKLIDLGGIPRNIYADVYTSLSEFDNKGIIIQPGVSISFDVKVGNSCIFHTNSVISHKVEIGNFVNISPLCAVLSDVTIGDESYLGAGTVIHPKIKIGKNVYITAGSIVNRDLKDFETFG